MPSTSQWVAFLVASILFIQVPGPSLLFTLGRALTVSLRDALTSAVGNGLGVVAQVLAVAVGLGALVAASATAYTAIKLVVPTFPDVVSPVELALTQEKRVTEQINGLLRTAREEFDFASEQFMQWFIKEQVEEVATMSDLLAVVRRNADDIDDIEDYVAREQAGGEGADLGAPPAAGA